MADSHIFPLDAVRTDGWFERIGEGIGSFQALCEIVGERFFAFSMITGARITAVMVDRRNPDSTLVDFTVGGAVEEPDADVQRLTLADFRRRLVGALLADEAPGPVPTRETDLEGLQLHIGVRYLLLAPLYGYSLRQLQVSGPFSELTVLHDGIEEQYELDAFRGRIRAHVREELDRSTSGHRGAIDLGRVAEAEAAAVAGDDTKVLQLLGAWPAPLAIFLRTPDGQLLPPEPRALIAKALGLLGTSCVRLGDVMQGEEILRLAVQYAQEGAAAADIFQRLGTALYDDGRPGEAIGPLRRAVVLGGELKALWPMLGRSFARRSKFVAAFACLRHAAAVGVPEADLAEDLRAIEVAIGAPLSTWRSTVGLPADGVPAAVPKKAAGPSVPSAAAAVSPTLRPPSADKPPAASGKAASDKAASDKAASDKAASDKAASDKAASESKAERESKPAEGSREAAEAERPGEAGRETT